MNKYFISFLTFFLVFTKISLADVLLIKIDSPITPVTEEFFVTALKKAEIDNYRALIVELDTPGGLVESTRKIVKEIFQSEIPVIVYVAPSGARAASAGTFILLASHIAVMAPGTHTGSAHPIALGQKLDNKTKEKIINDLIAWATNIAEIRGRNVEFAKECIVKSKSITEKQALKLGVIDFIAKDINELLSKAHGKKVKTEKGEIVLKLKNAKVHEFKESLKFKILKILTNPNIIHLLLLLGMLGIYFELAHPGTIFPGVIGVICLILSLVGLSVIPINYAGLALLLLAGLLFFLETQIPSHGLLTIGGIISLLLGSLMLFKPLPSEMGLSYSSLIFMSSVFALVFIGITYLAVKILRKKPVSGKEALIGKIGSALEDFETEGMITIEGEIWKAQTEVPIKKGQKVKVIAKEGLTLKIKPL